ncbi:uncharacterized protein LOC110825339 [Carica papaya]|uniref:uncharacterized protein LOC110825339 n=1 Tax=Carica papaya TaxID=3649 RepID=UPI000B8CC61C|nr:uncharacterized protein LOC110825339 [Carica papaya]
MSDEQVPGSPSTVNEENQQELVIQNLDHPDKASSQGSHDHLNPNDHVNPDDHEEKLERHEYEKTEEAPTANKGGGDGSGQKKKRKGRSKVDGDDQVGSSSGGVRKHKRPRVLDAPNCKPSCPECDKKFSSWKAMFGHMKKHPGKGYEGAFPPPKFTPPTSPKKPVSADEQRGIEEAVPALLHLARRMTGTDDDRETEEDGGGTRREIEINLNDSQKPQEEEPPSLSETGDVKGFDLNLTPPHEDN